MKLQQKKILLGSPSGKNLGKEDVIVLVINGKVRRDIPLSMVFYRKLKIGVDNILGYSILSIFKQSDHLLKHEDLSVNFFNCTTNEHLAIDKVITPAFQDFDITVSEEQIRQFHSVINSTAEMLPEPIKHEELKAEGPIATIEEELDMRKDLIQAGYKEHNLGNFDVFVMAGCLSYIFLRNTQTLLSTDEHGVFTHETKRYRLTYDANNVPRLNDATEASV